MGPRGTIYSGYQNQVFQGYPQCCLCAPSCCDWAATAVGTLVDGAGLSLASLEARLQLLWVSSGWSQHPMWLAKRPGYNCYVCVHEQSFPPNSPKESLWRGTGPKDAHQVRQGGSCLPCRDRRRPQGNATAGQAVLAM